MGRHPRNRTLRHLTADRSLDSDGHFGQSLRMGLVRVALAVSCVCATGCGAAAPGESARSDPPRVSSTAPTTLPTPTTPESMTLASTTTAADAIPGLPPWEEVASSGAWAGARTGTSPLELVVFIMGGPKYDPDDPCSMAYRATAEESPLAVEVTVFKASRRYTGPFGCDDIGYVQSIVVALKTPLGDRIVEAFGAPHGVFDGSQLAAPTWLPDGFTRQAEGPGYPSPETSQSWQVWWATPEPPPSDDGHCVPGKQFLTLTQGPPVAAEIHAANPNLAVVATYDIGGVEATYRQRLEPAPEAVLSWVRAGTAFDLYSSAACVPGGEAVDANTMVRFASGLVVPSPTP